MKDFAKNHPALYRAIRTFFQAAVGVIAAALISSHRRTLMELFSS